jgi:hypothetical protein
MGQIKKIWGQNFQKVVETKRRRREYDKIEKKGII